MTDQELEQEFNDALHDIHRAKRRPKSLDLEHLIVSVYLALSVGFIISVAIYFAVKGAS